MGDELSPVERIKARSDYLRGTLEKSLADRATGALAEDDTQLSKFHGFYQQDDRDRRAERHRRKLEPAYSFMIRVRVPGGILAPEQWLALDELAGHHAAAPLRLTTRQALQFHGVIKRDLKATIRSINDGLLDTIAACGDVNRNVMCAPLADFSGVHARSLQTAQAISDRLTPRTRAYHELWLDGEKVHDGRDDEPIYGPTYLPRKFKIALAIPPCNDVDVYAQDLGFIAIEENGRLAGFNVAVGGGMGATQGDSATYPRLADVIGFCRPEQAVDVAEQVVRVQRDFGDRGNRKHARLKYTIDDRGLDWFRQELAGRLGHELALARPFRFTSRGDPIGWSRAASGLWNLTLFVPEGRVRDGDRNRLRSALRALAGQHGGDFRLTPNQNLMVAGIEDAARASVERLLAGFGVDALQESSPLRRQALACVALPTCGLAKAEAERWLPALSDGIDSLLAKHGLDGQELSLRVSGCPNGCSRPYVAEIALVGKAPGRYDLHLGGSPTGDRLATLVAENLDEREILDRLDARLAAYAAERGDGEAFGDFFHRDQQAAGTETA